jgi:hypothetical protein
MSRIFNPCGEYRKGLCLLAAGALPPREHKEAETHVAACADCRKYYEGIQRVTVPLVNWEHNFAQVEPSRATVARWEKDFAAALAPAPAARFGFINSILDWVRDMTWPCRRIWAGFAAVWLMIIGINFSTREGYQNFAEGHTRPSPEMVRAYLEAEGFLAESTWPDKSRVAESPKHSLPPPRSERHPQVVRG